LGSVALASTTQAKLPADVIHVYLVNTSTTGAPGKFITGAFSDHGTSSMGVWYPTKGWIKVNTSKIKAILNIPNFGSYNVASCSFWGTAAGPATIVSGTGPYAGITGALSVEVSEAAHGSLLPNGKCNQANDAAEVAAVLLGTATGKVS
jgi:hypothetical protein